MNDKLCPECDGTLVYRLGEFECPDCGRRFTAQQLENTQTIERPGPLKEQRGNRASTGSQTLPGSSLYGVEIKHSKDAGNAVDYGDPLKREKKLYYRIQMIMNAIVCVLIICAIIQINITGTINNYDPDYVDLLVLGGYAQIILCAIIPFLLWHGLYGVNLYRKWKFLLLVIVGLICLGLSFNTPALFLMNIVAKICCIVIQIGLLGWLVHILWRDIHHLQYGE